MNLSNVLNIGANGLQAAAHGQNVTGQNISNAATEGYSRRITNLESVPLQHGGGVRANGSARSYSRSRRRISPRPTPPRSAARRESSPTT